MEGREGKEEWMDGVTDKGEEKKEVERRTGLIQEAHIHLWTQQMCTGND